MKTKFMTTDTKGCSSEEIQMSASIQDEIKVNKNFIEKDEINHSIFFWQKIYGNNVVAFRYSNSLVPQSK